MPPQKKVRPINEVVSKQRDRISAARKHCSELLESSHRLVALARELVSDSRILREAVKTQRLAPKNRKPE